MGDEEKRLVLPCNEFEQILLELPAGLFVDRRERLVHQENFAVYGERPRESHTLAHAAGQLVRVALFKTCQANITNVFLGNTLTFRHPHAPEFKPEGDVSQHVCPWQQGKVLEHESTIRAWPFHPDGR